MFDKRDDLVRFLAVAESGKILAAADRLAITQPALSRVIARLEARFGGKLFERLTTGVRLTPLGDRVAGVARGLLREIQAAEEKIDAAVSGRTMSLRVTASPMWMEAVLAPAVAQFHHRFPSVELTLRTAPFADGLRFAGGWRERSALRRHRCRKAVTRLSEAPALHRHDRWHRWPAKAIRS